MPAKGVEIASDFLTFLISFFIWNVGFFNLLLQSVYRFGLTPPFFTAHFAALLFLNISCFIFFCMLSFINSASEHAHALVYFHHYAFFFLLVVVFFVIWLLKLVLNFVVLERSLRLKPVFYFFGFGFFVPTTTRVFLLFSLILAKLPPLLLTTFLDIFFFLLIFNTRDTLRHNYEMHQTMYPDLGAYVNVFTYMPTLVEWEGRSNYIRPFSQHYNIFNIIKKNSSPVESVSVSYFYSLLHDLPFLMPFERINIKMVDPWSSAECAVILLNFNNFFYINTKCYFTSTSDSLISTLLRKKFSYLFSLNSMNFRRHDFWYRVSYYNLPFSSSFFSRSFSYSNRNILNYSPNSVIHNFSRANLTVSADNIKLEQGCRSFNNLLMNNKSLSRSASFFYSTESRAFFYLFFQNVRHKKILEWVWTCVPALILILILYPSLVILYCYDRPYVTKPYLTFKAVGHQWYWSYEYSDFLEDNAEFQHVKFDSYMLHEEDLLLGRFRLLEVDRRLVLPVGICLRLITTSADVLHSWAVPALGVKIDAVPGRLNQFWIVIDRPGTFYGQCSELCGVNHGFMPTVVEGVSVDTFFDYLNIVGVL